MVEVIKVGASSSGGGGSHTALFELLRRPNITAQEIEDYSNTSEGMAAWATLSALPTAFVEGSVAAELRKCPSVIIALSSNETVKTQIGTPNYNDMLSTKAAIEFASKPLEEIQEICQGKFASVLFQELSLSYDAAVILGQDIEKVRAVLTAPYCKQFAAMYDPFHRALARLDIAPIMWGDMVLRRAMFDAGLWTIRRWADVEEIYNYILSSCSIRYSTYGNEWTDHFTGNSFILETVGTGNSLNSFTTINYLLDGSATMQIAKSTTKRKVLRRASKTAIHNGGYGTTYTNVVKMA